MKRVYRVFVIGLAASMLLGCACLIVWNCINHRAGFWKSIPLGSNRLLVSMRNQRMMIIVHSDFLTRAPGGAVVQRDISAYLSVMFFLQQGTTFDQSSEPRRIRWEGFGGTFRFAHVTSALNKTVGGVVLPFFPVGLGLAVIAGLVIVYQICRFARESRARRGLCRKCGYSREGAVSDRCPECGEVWRGVG